jgi:hypothetical protein
MLALTVSGLAQNLLLNGDFELNGGSLTNWTGGGVLTTVATAHTCTLTDSSEQQTVATEVGTKYYVAIDVVPSGASLATSTLSAVPAAGGAPDGIRTFSSGPIIPPGTTSNRIGLIFTASSASTNITFSVTGTGAIGFPVIISGSAAFDNAVLYKLAPSTYAGRYSGNAATSVSITSPAVSSKVTVRAAGRVAPDGQVVAVVGSSQVLSGIVLNDGTFEVGSGFGLITKGTLKSRSRLAFSVPGTALPAFDINGALLPNTVTTNVTLTRVGR